MGKWIWGILLALLALVLVAGVLVVVGFIKLGEAFSSDTQVTIRMKPEGGGAAFELGYGKDITGLAAFIVTDADGKELWKVEGMGERKPGRVVYGEVPEGGKQAVPAGGKPEDIRGRHVKVEISCRFHVALGVGHESTRVEFDVPK